MTLAEKENPDLLAEQHRQEIVDAAERLVKEKGLHQLKLRDIAHESGKSLGNLYNYFQNKEAIVEALIEREKMRFLALACQDPDFLNGGSYIENMRRHFERIADAYMDPDRVRLSIFIACEAVVNPRINKILVEANSAILEHILKLIDQTPAVGLQKYPRELIKARVVMTRSFFESLRGAVIFHPDIDRELLKKVLVDRLMSIWISEFDQVKNEDRKEGVRAKSSD